MELCRGSARLTFQLGSVTEYKLQLLCYMKGIVVHTDFRPLCLEYYILGQTSILYTFKPISHIHCLKYAFLSLLV